MDEGRVRGWVEQLVIPLISVVIAIGIGSLIIWATGYDPIEAYSALFKGAFGGPRQIGETLMRSTPLIFTGLAIAYGFKAGLFNIGAEGQLFMGGLAAAFLGIQLAGLPQLIALPMIILGGALAGAAWAFIPAVLKARVGAHEVITTMMFSYIARYIVSYLVTGPLKAEGQIPQTEALPPESTMPLLTDTFSFLPTSRLHWGFFLAVVLAVFMWWLLKYTTLGYENRAVGFNQWASETGGISVSRTIIKSLCISGAFAGRRIPDCRPGA
jgi:simple sugar transport system permease protein